MKPWRTGWYNSNIHTHILLTCLVPALLLGLLLIAYFTFTRLQELRTELHDTGQLIASQLAPAAEYGVITANVPVLDRPAAGQPRHRPCALRGSPRSQRPLAGSRWQ